MAYSSTISHTGGVSLKSPFVAIGAFFSRIGHAMITANGNSGRLREVEMLNAKSDAELAEMGITRDKIVHHVFRDLYYI
ncbi:MULTISPECIES: hypothetical protein [unclassified Sulfitobacter]|jgi:hypothetical protein|uniref:hypothetical protein n=1 Tax=unclassified Sulfitobacter TaxID=196795 RepID=UPI00159440BA|nr:hypothetical protein [Sulfitobacter sp. HGT1]MBQ0805102.1 hypothetical protein [Sulfitobacter sp.]